MIRCEPDKVRFCDEDATRNERLIHTIDLSDERSASQFVTLWFKGNGEAVQQWRRERGLDNHHNRELYHREPPWLPAKYPGMQRRFWSTHTHIDLSAPPQWSDLEPFLDEIPLGTQQEIQSYLKV